MKEEFIELTDGTRLQVRINFGTLYYLQKCKGFYAKTKKVEQKKKLRNDESFELAANIIYAVLRSNGKVVTQEEALQLMPPDTDSIKKLLNDFQEEYEKYSKKKQAKSYPMKK